MKIIIIDGRGGMAHICACLCVIYTRAIHTENTMYQFVATDLDGTLLNEDKTIDDLTAQTFQALAAKGLTLIVATGRHHVEAKHVRSRLGTGTFLAASNGARIYAPDDSLIFSADIEPELVRALAQEEFTAGTRLCLYHDDGCMISLDAPEFSERHTEFTYLRRDLPLIDGEGISKMLFFGDSHARLRQLAARMQERFPGKIATTFADLHCLEVMAADVSKGSAIRYLASRLNLKLEHGIAFGDSLNDVEMLKTVGTPFLMGNANEQAAKQLPGIDRVASNEESGVARQLRHLFRMV
ncbi:HAD family hydrolase [Paludibacterium yongneupense]|uniref:HAD family hydrolase n=1 Tax=Paludibacterium yongneupense TaxID=400061 RepID=UPI00146A3A82|nr:HAD family hydrolase [Paludibacterium yongneupense]